MPYLGKYYVALIAALMAQFHVGVTNYKCHGGTDDSATKFATQR